MDIFWNYTFLGVVKIGGPCTWSIKGGPWTQSIFDGPGPWSWSMERVHGPGVHVLYSPSLNQFNQV